MAVLRSCSSGAWTSVLLLLLSFLSLINFTSTTDTQYVQTTTNSGETILLPDDRKPALYTQNFGDCLGNSLINVTRFDAAYYQDNMTVLFHLEGNTNVANESVMRTFMETAILTIHADLTQCTLVSLPMGSLVSILPSIHVMLRYIGKHTLHCSAAQKTDLV